MGGGWGASWGGGFALSLSSRPREEQGGREREKRGQGEREKKQHKGHINLNSFPKWGGVLLANRDRELAGSLRHAEKGGRLVWNPGFETCPVPSQFHPSR